MEITKEEFDSLQVGDELVSEDETLKVEIKMPNTIIVYNLDNKYSAGYSLYELQEYGFQLKPKIKHLHGFPVGDYSDKNVFVACSDKSLEDAKKYGKIAILTTVSKDNEFVVKDCFNDGHLIYKYAILLSDNVELVKE